MEKSALRQIFRWANRVGIVSRLPEIKAPKLRKGHEVVRRPAFEADEWQELQAFLFDWFGLKKPDNATAQVSNGGHGGHQWQRKMFSAYVLFLYHSGLRPNEARQLRWRDTTQFNDEQGETHILLHVSPETKTGERDVVPQLFAKLALHRVREISLHTGPDDFVFCSKGGAPIDNFGKTFKKVLTELDLLKDRYGRTRTIYSLRHTYATCALLRGINAEDLAQNMGTSPMQIHRHYRHIRIQQKAEQMGGQAPMPSPGWSGGPELGSKPCWCLVL